MSRRCWSVWWIGLSVLAIGGGLVGDVWAEAPAPTKAESSQLLLYAHPDGTKYFGLCLRPQVQAEPTGGRSIAILFDTSAGQVGDFRAKALEVLEQILQKLGPEDQVELIGVDVNAIPLTEGFVAAQSDAMKQAVAKLRQRTPLGATDMEKALLTAAEQFQSQKGKLRSVIYLGKGTSKAKLLDAASFADLLKQLKDGRISVHSYAIGPGPDLRLLGALAAQTGGNLTEDSPAEAGAIADQLVSGVQGPVFWPIAQKVVWSEGIREIYPADLPPLRLDRETVLVGVLQGDSPVTIRASVEGPSGQVDLSWTATAPAPSDDHNYLPPLVDLARKDSIRGMSLPLVSAASLKNAKLLADAGATNLSILARQALAASNPAEAERLAQAALKQDPQQPEAQAILRAVQRQQTGQSPPAGQAGPAPERPGLQLQGNMAPPPAVPGAGVFVEQYQQKQNLIAQMISTDITQTINHARSIMTDNPDGAIHELKVAMENVRRVPELEEAVRTRLVGQLEAALRESYRRKQIKEERDRQRDITLAQARERTLVQENLQRTEEKIRQLVARFNSLMAEGRYAAAEEGAAALRKEAPSAPISEQAMYNAQAQGIYTQTMQTLAERDRMFIATLFQVEKSHVPFPDEPPIVYPDADTWQQLTARRKERYQAMDLASRGPAEKKILQQLDSPTQLEFSETPLNDVIQYLKDFHKIEIQLDKKALEAAGVNTDKAVTINLKGVSLRSALRLLLRELDLTYIIQNEVLLITSPDEAQNRLSTKVYPVADLVIPIQTPAFQGGFGGLGGWGGGMGMGGMGMGGMGMGGMGMGGMGMGGMGMGGMGNMFGGGMWNIPPDRLPQPVRNRLDQLLPKKGEQGFRAFSVPESSARAESPTTAASASGNAEKVQKELMAINSPEGYESFFAAHQNPPVDPAVVRQAVRDLMNDKKFTQVSALIEAALRNHQPQPWMYEALGLAMQADGRPMEEIERVILSALDFAQSPAEMTYIGLYLSQLGLEKRALQIYRQAAQINPRRPEPYLAALRSAQKLNDLQAKQWASLGILQQAWPQEQIEVWNTARRVAQSVLEELRSAGKTKEAQEFEKAMQTAMVRDVVIRVQWTGNADVDLLVEEPTGSICSARNPRSSGGGIFLGDISSRQLDSVHEGPAEEIYVCPEGFSGTYRALIRRVWGELTAGKVQVEVLTHFRSEKQRRIAQTIDLKNDEAVVVFDLQGGRRKESLQEVQTANALVDQLSIRQQILAQQIAAAVDPRALAALATSRTSAGSQDNNGGGTNPYFPWTIHGAVGYQPVIITLPEGTNLAATGVVSADRRYVRVTCVPLFSRISDVRIFNFSTGEESQGRLPGTGGGGYTGGGGGY